MHNSVTSKKKPRTMLGTRRMEISKNKKGPIGFLTTFKVEMKNVQQAHVSGGGSRSEGGGALLPAPAGRSLKDYTVDGGLQSSGLRNHGIRAQGLGVSCPTRDKTATRHINHGRGRRSHHGVTLAALFTLLIPREGLRRESKEQCDVKSRPPPPVLNNSFYRCL